jgi:N-acetylglucosamine kinase-like BadF-type ATPase
VSKLPFNDDALTIPPTISDVLLAVDAGGSKTVAWLVDPARSGKESILGIGRSSAGNPLSVGFAEATRAINEAVSQARSNACCRGQRVPRAILSIAGAANPELHDQLLTWTHEIILAERIAIVSDVLPVLAAGTPNCCGVAVISGTGSVALARASDGRTARCGGWGYLLGDEGSGYAIGRAGLQHALLNLETGKPVSPLGEAFLQALKADSVLSITRTIYRSADPRGAVAALATVVIQAAEKGIVPAQTILEAAAADLAQLVSRTVSLIGWKLGRIPLAVSGGVMVSSKLLQQQLDRQLIQIGLDCDTTVVEEPIAGCVRLATTESCASLITWH